MKQRNFKLIIRNYNVRKLAYLIHAKDFAEATKFSNDIMRSHGFHASRSTFQTNQTKIVRYFKPKDSANVRIYSPVEVVIVDLYYRHYIDKRSKK